MPQDDRVPPSPGPRLFTVAELVGRLGLGRSSVYQLIEGGQIRSARVGRKILVSEAAVLEFIERAETTGVSC